MALSQNVMDSWGDVLLAGPRDPERREACRDDLLLFCKTYLPDTFALEWSPAHRSYAEKVDVASREGKVFAGAMPRGRGKTSIAKAAVLRSALYGFSEYSVLIGATAQMAKKILRSIKSWLFSNDLLHEDFPEITCVVRHIRNNSLRAKGLHCDGREIGLLWEGEQIVFPSMPHLPYCRCNEAVIDVTGITGEIRGRQYSRLDGRTVRPSLVLIDDPQTRKSAMSVHQCETREDTIKGDVRFLAGQGKSCGIVLACTVIRKGDVADRMLSRELNPEWQGERWKFLESLPANVTLWHEYHRIRDESFENDGDGREATEFYRQHQVEMDAGAVSNFLSSFDPDKHEISSVQHFMNLWLSDETTAMSEYQNDPQETASKAVVLDPAYVARRQTRLEQGIVPQGHNTLTSFVDVSQDCLWWAVVAWSSRMVGAVVDYGVWPPQPGRHVHADKVLVPLREKYPGTSIEGAIEAGLDDLIKALMTRRFAVEASEGQVGIERLCVDEGKWNEPIRKVVRRSAWSATLRTYKGFGIRATSRPLIVPSEALKPGEKRHPHCKDIIDSGTRRINADVNYWKTFVANGLLQPWGEPSSIALYRQTVTHHRMIAEQLCAEQSENTLSETTGQRATEWSNPGDPDNHFFDCLTGCAVAASTLGLRSDGQQDAKRQGTGATKSFRELAMQKRGRR